MSSVSERVKPLLASTHARIDLDRYEQNIRILHGLAGVDRDFMAVIKANAYGHGALACARAASSAGASYLAVARISEALRLRRAGIHAPILTLGSPNPEMIERAIENDVTLTVGTLDTAERVLHSAGRLSRRSVVHLKIDTGLHRYGADPELALRLALNLVRDDRVELEGLYAHFSSADELDLTPTTDQTDRAQAVIDELMKRGISVRYIHLPNSAATITGQIGPSTLVRSGIATYGLRPSGDVSLPDGVKPVMSIYSRLARVFDLQAGEGVSYGLTYRAGQTERLATVPVGYADGLPRSLSNQGWFVVNGRCCPIRGRVCMDQTVIGLPAAAHEGTEIQIVGDGDDEAMTLDRIASLDGTINYEIAARLAARVPRIYIRGGEPIAWEDEILGESEGI